MARAFKRQNAPWVDLVFEQRPQEIPVPFTPGSHQHPRDRTLFLVCRLLCQRFFFSGKAVEHEVVRYIGHLGVALFLGYEAEVKEGVKVDTSPQPPRDILDFVPDRRTPGCAFVRRLPWRGILVRRRCLDALPGLATSKVVLLKSSGARAQTSGEEYTTTLCDASLKPLDRREASSWSPVHGWAYDCECFGLHATSTISGLIVQFYKMPRT